MRRGFRLSWIAGFCLAVGLVTQISAADRATKFSTEAVEARLSADIHRVAGDEMEGRGLGSKGLDLTAEYIYKTFEELGLKTTVFGDSPYQNFKMATSTEMGPKEKNRAALIGPPDDKGKPKIDLKLDTDFTPLSLGGSAKFDLPLVFAGYGITANKEKYDDYAQLDVKGKAVVILRREPQQANPHSVFNGTQDSEYAPLTRKISNAYEHGAAAVILCTDQFDIQKHIDDEKKKWREAVDKFAATDAEFRKIERPTNKQVEEHRKKLDELGVKISECSKKLAAASDPLLGFNGGGPGGEGRNLPIIHCRRAEIDKLVERVLKKDLATIEKEIDKDLKPLSAELTGWTIQGETNVVKKEVEIKNVGAILEGEGEHADETIVIGAHYDHVGRGGPGSGSLEKGSTAIHNGADDNGSGTVALLEVARQLASRQTKLPRRILFLAFTGEERGLIGSARYCREPAIPLSNTVAMLNMDMVGRLKDNKLVVYGTGTAAEFDKLVDRLGEKYEFAIKKDPSGFGPSDHASFYAKEIPVLHYFTGMHSDYHRPGDKPDKINVNGIRRVAEMVVESAVEIAQADKRPEYRQTKSATPRDTTNPRPYFGAIPDYTPGDEPGLALTGVSKDSPADKGGVKANDIIIKLADSQIANIEDFDSALRKHKAGDKVTIVVKRGKEEVRLEVTLGTPK